MSTLLSDVDRTARKRHVCCHCRTAIEPGTRYREARYAWDGTAATSRSHLPCDRLVRLYVDDLQLRDDEPIEWSDLLDWVRHEPDVELPDYLQGTA